MPGSAGAKGWGTQGKAGSGGRVLAATPFSGGRDAGSWNLVVGTGGETFPDLEYLFEGRADLTCGKSI